MAEAKRLHTPEGTPPSHRTLVTPSHSQQVMQVLRQLYEEEHLCDYTILAEGQAFRTHRNVIAAVSDYFQVMLTGPMMEARQDHVDLKGVTANAVKTLLDFAYSGQLGLNLDSVVEVLAGACHLQMRSGIELCCDFLVSELSGKTCVDILNIADMFALPGVKDLALEYVIRSFDKISELDQFYKIHKEHLLVVLQSNLLRFLSEMTLFLCVQKWIDFDRDERGKFALELFQHIRFALMKPEELVDHVSQTHFMVSDAACRTLLDEALHYHVLPGRHPLMQTPRTRVRNEPCIVGLGGRYGMNIGYKYNCNKMYALHGGKWFPLANSESNFLYAAVAVLDNFMYVCGGMGKPAHARATCQRFDPRTGTWTRLSHMRTRRQSFPLVALHDKVFAFGGGTPVDSGLEHPPTDKCEVYSIDKNEWTGIAPLPEKRKSASACVYGGKIYISGGRTDDKTCCTLWCYDLERDAWETKSPMILPHAGHVMVECSNKLYVIDRTNLSIEAYDPLLDEWCKVQPSSGGAMGIARPASLGSWVYFLSFLVDQDADFQCKRYNMLTLETEDLPCYPEPVHCVIGAPLCVPRHCLVDTNNNNNNKSSSNSQASSS